MVRISTVLNSSVIQNVLFFASTFKICATLKQLFENDSSCGEPGLDMMRCKNLLPCHGGAASMLCVAPCVFTVNGAQAHSRVLHCSLFTAGLQSSLQFLVIFRIRLIATVLKDPVDASDDPQLCKPVASHFDCYRYMCHDKTMQTEATGRH